MYTVQRNAGRLLTVYLGPPFVTNDIIDAITQCRMHFLGSSDKLVFFADASGMDALSPDNEKLFFSAFTRDNPKVERSAIYLGTRTSALFTQVERLIREAKNPARKAFRTVDDAASYLNEILTPDEQRALKNFTAALPVR